MTRIETEVKRPPVPDWRRLKAAGFTRRDERLTCDECGKKFSRQFLPIHKCEADEQPEQPA